MVSGFNEKGKLNPLLNKELLFKKHFSLFPATRSRTATLLRLHPNCLFFNGLN
jgi:hypothetical protein